VLYIVQQSIPPFSALLCRDRHISIPSVLIGAVLFQSAICTLISAVLILGWELLNFHLRSKIGFYTPYPPTHIAALLCWESSPQSPSVLLYLYWRSSILFCTPDLPPPFQRCSAGLDAPQSPSALCSIDLALFLFIPSSCNTALRLWRSSFPWLLVPFSIQIYHIFFQNPIWIPSWLTSPYTFVSYHKVSQTTLEFNFSYSPGTNNH